MTISLAQFEHITSAAGLSAAQAADLKIAYDATVTLATAPEVTGVRADGTALADLLTTLATLGLITDSTTAS